MNTKLTRLLVSTILWISLQQFVDCPVALSQTTQQTSPTGSTPEAALTEEGGGPFDIVLDGRPVVTVYGPIGTLTPEARASGIEKRILSLARTTNLPPDAIRLEPREGWTELFLGKKMIMAVTESDAKIAGKPRQQVALESAEGIRQAITNYRRDHSWRLVLRGILNTLIATAVLVALLWCVRRIQVLVRDRIQRQIERSAQLEKKSGWDIFVAYLGPITLAAGAILRWVVILGLFEGYLTITLGFFAFTREISLTITNWLFSQLASMGHAVLDYVPNLFVLAVIVLVTNYGIRLVRLIFAEIQKGDLKIRGFYPDWAEPTAKLIRMLILVLALIVGFPYLPGAKSPAFQGISIFLGVLLSLGSSSAVANAIAGIILTYMRSFLVGDWVQIGDTIGEVTEKTLLVTRVLTPKSEIITIPNSTVMSGPVKNYSVEARKSGVIFHTTATIGYEAPWRTVHDLLVNSALATEHVLQNPRPFVLQSRLDDFYVAYELNAYTDAPRLMLDIYSSLHQNIQDKFNEAGVEICSPHFSSLRDGNTVAIPQQYHPPDYEAPSFRVNSTATAGTPSPTAPSLRNTSQPDSL
jgi:small-conductance mechanosensitive channel